MGDHLSMSCNQRLAACVFIFVTTGQNIIPLHARGLIGRIRPLRNPALNLMFLTVIIQGFSDVRGQTRFDSRCVGSS